MFCNSADWGRDCCVVIGPVRRTTQSHVAAAQRCHAHSAPTRHRWAQHPAGKRQSPTNVEGGSPFSNLKEIWERQMNWCKVSQGICKPNIIIQTKSCVAKQNYSKK